ncbi:maleylpyruvate isomerase N-terminal domain-containing protein [Pseudarthrobacter phenanthrenivorans]|uniref:maleylpyruvate isomerase N-terminal domain-containing protein n=1 Tax=Pseudarthrobacter phenanthrenivorans TaxID=361575 RepID=UPI003F7F40B7
MVARHDQTTDPVLLDGLLQARRGTAFFARKLNELTDADLDGDSLLPGWSRRHVGTTRPRTRSCSTASCRPGAAPRSSPASSTNSLTRTWTETRCCRAGPAGTL